MHDDLPEPLQFPGWEKRLKKVRRDYLREDRIVDILLLQGVAALVDVLKNRLRHHFEMTWLSDIFMEWEEIKPQVGKRSRSTSWVIEDEVDARAVGCTQAQLLDTYRDVSAPTKQGPPNEDRKPDRMSKLRKKRGHPKAMPTVVHRWGALLRKHGPELFPKPEPPKSPPSTAVVVPFKR